MSIAQSAPKIVNLKEFRSKRDFHNQKEELKFARSFASRIDDPIYPLFTLTMTPEDIKYIVNKFALAIEHFEKEEYFVGLIYADYFAYLYDIRVDDQARDELIKQLNSMPEHSILEVEAPWHSKSLIEKNNISMIVESDNVMWHFKLQNVYSPRLPAKMFYELYEDLGQ
jgi:hypothetical protein